MLNTRLLYAALFFLCRLAVAEWELKPYIPVPKCPYNPSVAAHCTTAGEPNTSLIPQSCSILMTKEPYKGLTPKEKLDCMIKCTSNTTTASASSCSTYTTPTPLTTVCGCTEAEIAGDKWKFEQLLKWVSIVLRAEGYWLNWGLVGSLQGSTCSNIIDRIVQLLDGTGLPAPTVDDNGETIDPMPPKEFACINLKVLSTSNPVTTGHVALGGVCKNPATQILFTYDYWETGKANIIELGPGEGQKWEIHDPVGTF